MKQGGQNVNYMKRNGWRSLLKLGVVVTILTLWAPAKMAQPDPSVSDSLTVSVTDSLVTAPADTMVWFTPAEAGSLLVLIDTQRIDLWEIRKLAALDSSWAVEREHILQQRYDALLKQQDNWFERAVKHPMLWLVLGLYLGVNAETAE